MRREKVSENVIARLPQYYRCINELYDSNCVRVSSSTLSDRIGFSAAQIRQDFSHFGEFGQQGYGYNVRKLRYEIREILGLNSHNTCILLGCGNLGKALLQNFNFEDCGFFMVEAFDKDPAVVGTTIRGVEVSGVERLELMLDQDHPDMAVLTVPREEAQRAADILVEGGISAIWNFTGAEIQISNSDVVVENVSFADSLMKLSYHLNLKREETDEPVFLAGGRHLVKP